MRNQLKIVYSALTIVAMLGLTSTVHGIPAFARQTGLDCNSCHASVGYPSLNSFGQAFRAGGYTQASEDSLMGDGEALSLPKTMNLAVVTKIRAHFYSQTSQGAATPNTTAVNANTNPTGLEDETKTTTVGFNRLDLPDEWAIWLAGRAGKHVGFATEFNGDGPVGFKIPIVYDIGPLKAGFVTYWTDAQGPGWGFETLSTGAVGNIRMFEDAGMNATSARMYLDAKGLTGNDGNAAGAGIYLWHPMGFVYYSPYLISAAAADLFDTQFAHNIRAAFTPSFGGIDLAVGVQFMTGNTGKGGEAADNANGILASVERTYTRVNSLVIDAQVAGTIGIPLFLIANYGMADSVVGTNGKAKAGTKGSVFTIALNATIIEDLLNVGVGFRSGSFADYVLTAASTADAPAIEQAKDGKNALSSYTDNQLVAELKFNISRNLRLSLTGYKQLNAVDVEDSTGYKKQTTTTGNKTDKLVVMLFGAF